MSVFLQQNVTENAFETSNSWVILSPIEQQIKNKIESAGIPLRDWNINIYRGILTGCNEAFIISSAKRKEILDDCSDINEYERTNTIIQPILRGRDIKKYAFDWNDLWLINTHNGLKEKNIPKIDIENFPAIKRHLDRYWEKIKSRSDQGDTPYNLRSCAYMEDFLKPKILYPDISQGLGFCYYPDPIYCSNTAYFITSENNDDLLLLIDYLNSKLIDWYYRTLSVQLGETAVRMFSIYVLNIPVPKSKLHQDIYDSFNLNDEEIDFIESWNSN